MSPNAWKLTGLLWAATAQLAVAQAPPTSPNPPSTPSLAPSITAAVLLETTRALSTDEMEGRAPGSVGEQRAVSYLVERLRRLGLSPGNPDGTFVQRVPMIAFTGEPRASFEAAGRRTELAYPDDFVAVSRRGLPEVAVDDSEIVFVGYGVVAPELGWDDFKDVDVRGKTILMLVGDPPVPDPARPGELDAATFKGAAMTYYGRWTYKYESAARHGAAAVLLIHETGPAGYPWSVVRGSWTGESFELDAPEELSTKTAVEGWITLERARQLVEACGRELPALKAAALSREFRPVPLGVTASLSVRNRIRSIASQNVLARLPGSDPAVRDEAVMYSAHWDHLGRKPTPGPGSESDTIVNGALDNGSGMATMLAIAEAFTRLPQPPRRSLLFFAPTGEESGLLGARFYAAHPLWPLERTLADVNMDMMNFWGRTRAIVSIAQGMSTLDEVLAAEATRQGRVVLPDPEAEKGYFYRSDHFELAKRGVPALHFLHPGAEYRDRPADYGRRMRDRYTAEDYHQVSDEVKADWDLSGAVEDARLLFAVGLDLATTPNWPQWKPGSEFKSIREESLRAAPPRH